MAHPGGRPSLYNDQTCTNAQEYLDSCVDQQYTRVKTEGDKSVSYDNLIKVKLPTKEGLALHLDVAMDTLYDWGKKYPQFSDILDKLNRMRAERLQNGGLSGEYNSTIAKLLLSKHGYVDRQEVTGADGGPQEHVVVSSDNNDLVKEYEEKLKKRIVKGA
jgi:hypothetical protein